MAGRVRRTAGLPRLVRGTLSRAYGCLDPQCYALEARVKRADADLILTHFVMLAARWTGG
jgi:hypothetical protein